MTSREAALLMLGADDVRAYERVKTFYTRYGLELERAFARAVGGRVGARGEPDVVTRLGGWEFCASANTKNAAGDAAQRAKVGPARVVQVAGAPRPGRISGVHFLVLHHVVDAERVAGELEAQAAHRAKVEALQLSLLGRSS